MGARLVLVTRRGPCRDIGQSAWVNGVPGALYLSRKRQKFTFFHEAFGDFPLQGKRVLDVGCGHGALVLEAALVGAQVVGIDLSEEKLAVGWHEAQNLCLDKSVSFWVADAVTYQDEPFDIIISYEVLEHVKDLAGVLENMYQLLKTGGTAYICWGGMWPSVFGGHYWLMKHLGPFEIPWSHRLFTKPTERPGVNQLDYKDYVQIIQASPFHVVSWRENVGLHWGYKIFRALAGIPGLRDAFTQNVYVELERR